jgi:Carboxypeptidase regulatory-like domain/TonB-dependent Receptor Plug Domain
MQRLLVQCCVLVCFAFAITATGFAQSGSIQGSVLDPQGNVIANAKVVAIDESKGIVIRETQTDRNGSFQLLPLLRGTYTLKVESTGFRALERKGLVLDALQILNLGELKLEVGDITNTVVVTGEAPIVETATANKSFVITSEQVTGIATNGRDFRSLLRTLPGVTSNAQSDFNLGFNSTQMFNVNGMRDSMNNVYLDGTINTDVGANDGQFTQMSLDAIGEFKVQSSNFNAEYGRNPGVLISATTKSGGRQFHGTAYEFLRNDALDARNPLSDTKAKLRLNQFGGNISGPVPLGKFSPMNDPKAFFFFNMEWTRGTRPNGSPFVDVAHPDILNGDFSRLLRSELLMYRDELNMPQTSTCLYPGESAPRGCQVGTVFVPGSIERDARGNIITGTPFANNTIPRTLWNSNADAFLRVIGSLNRAGAAVVPTNPELVRVFTQDSYQLKKRQEVVRFDYNINSKNNFFFRWVDDSQDENQGLGMFSNNSYPVLPQFRKKPGSSWSWNLISSVSPTITNEFIFGYNHLTQVVDIRPGVDQATYDRDQLGFTFTELFPQGSNLRNKFPAFSCGIGACNFFSFANNWESEARQFAWTDNVTISRGRHTFKTGAFFNMNRNGQQPAWTDEVNLNFDPGANNPQDTGNTFANMLLGNYTSASQSNGKFFGDFKFYGLELYGQDSWKVSPRFTLEYGLRWAYLGPTFTHGDLLMNYFLVDRYDQAQAVTIAPDGSIVPNTGNPLNGLVEEGNGIPKGGVRSRKNNFSPRLGFAYDVFGDGRTAVRGGFGIFYERIRQNNNYFDGLGNPPVTDTPNLAFGNLDNFGPGLISGATRFPANLIAIDPDGNIPTIYSWSLGVQHELPGQIGVDIAYIGNMGRHLMYQRNINQALLGTAAGAAVPNALRPFRGYGTITSVDFGANSNYNALQTRVGRRFGSNFTFNVNYTWGKAITDTDSDSGNTGTIGYFLDRGRERAVAGFDRTHILTIDYIYNLPKFSSYLGSNGVARAIIDGWTVSGVTRVWSGSPFTVTSTGNPGTIDSPDTNGSPHAVRADYLGGEIYVKDDASRMWFNPLVFGRPADGQLGNTGRNFLRGPGLTNFDLSLFKIFKFTERVNLQYRAEFFNIFNNTQWFGFTNAVSAINVGPGVPVTDLTRGQTGIINQARDPRNIQMALKLTF